MTEQTPPFDGFVTFVYTPDLERAAAFYGGALGLPLVLDEGPARIYQIAEKGYLGVCIAGEDSASVPEGICLTLVTEDVDGVYERLVAKGVETDGAPQALPQFGVYSFLLRDPDGHVIEVQRFENPAWKG
ncbi:MAG: VOC family protein [Rhodospirillaceae bacterium]|jgi:predicted enzyme related to lactoylglutathione lyase|nr:VOC family protein [Rhodospirillaceae bacterium]MBT6510390.1 VOC family protein [Rhodospirillaceae bacterium]MBT7613406.1 VOC family protein [Rhodospirillaceae bacterium]MBT7648965.1 VOC family protein [Rhodospirillaceae bacterium]